MILNTNRVDIGIVEKEIQDNAIKCKEIMEDEMVYIYKKSIQPRMDICFVREKGLEQGFIRK